MKPWLLRLHRWVALLFALPLVVVLLTGLFLSFEPWLVVSSIKPGSLTVEKVDALIAQHDPRGQAREISFRSYDHTLTISAGRGGGTTVDVGDGELTSGPSTLARWLVLARRMHENLLLNAGWLVIASTVAMLVLSALGVLMGLPRIANTVSGWHKAMAWGALPLIVLSPLTGLLIVANVTFATPGASAPGSPIPLREAVRIVGADHDLSTLVWLRPQGGRVLARLVEDGEYVGYTVTRDGLVATPRNWPRLFHEGNFAGMWSSLMNVIASLAMIGLLVTGPWLWLRRKLRLRAHRARVAPAE